MHKPSHAGYEHAFASAPELARDSCKELHEALEQCKLLCGDKARPEQNPIQKGTRVLLRRGVFGYPPEH